MSHEITTENFKEEWKNVRKELVECAKKIQNYKTRNLNDESRKITYKNEILRAHNKIVQFVKDCIENFTLEA